MTDFPAKLRVNLTGVTRSPVDKTGRGVSGLNNVCERAGRTYRGIVGRVGKNYLVQVLRASNFVIFQHVSQILFGR